MTFEDPIRTGMSEAFLDLVKPKPFKVEPLVVLYAECASCRRRSKTTSSFVVRDGQRFCKNEKACKKRKRPRPVSSILG